MPIEIRRLRPGDDEVLAAVAPGTFDEPIDMRLTAEFLGDPRHHMFVALDEDVVVGMASAVHYVHPDKPTQLWINEVGVAPSHQRRGIARALLDALLAHGRTLGAAEAWLGTEEDNVAARRLYESAGGKAESFVLYAFELGSGA